MKVQTEMVQSCPDRQTESETESYTDRDVIKEVAEENTIHGRLNLFGIGQKRFYRPQICLERDSTSV